MVVRVTGFDIFLATVEYGLRRQQLCKDAANRPDVWKKNNQTWISGCVYTGECCSVGVILTDGFGVMPSTEQKLRRSVPESDHHRVKIG